MNKIERAGLVPCYINDDGELEMMFMKPSDPTYGGSDYQIAKGKIEVGESEMETAIREAREELGLKLDNISHTFYCGKFLGRTYIFASIVNSKENFDPFMEDETESVTWMTMEQFAKEGRDIHIDVVACVVKEINDMHPSM